MGAASRVLYDVSPTSSKLVDWCAALARTVDTWVPRAELELELNSIVTAVRDACEQGEAWLYHPCMSALTLAVEDGNLERDFQLATWVAAHSRAPIGKVTAPRPLWAWARDGGRLVPPGRHDLGDVGAPVSAATSPGFAALDVWCDSVALPQRQSWAANPPVSSWAEQQLQDQIEQFFRVIDAAAVLLPNWTRWAGVGTSVVVPLRSERVDEFRSSSSPDIPGLVCMDVTSDPALVLEALTHESAHHHLYMWEASGPLVDPDHRGMYTSPLRSDLRPLRGILLAYHALVFIELMYLDTREVGIVVRPTTRDELGHLERDAQRRPGDASRQSDPSHDDRAGTPRQDTGSDVPCPRLMSRSTSCSRLRRAAT